MKRTGVEHGITAASVLCILYYEDTPWGFLFNLLAYGAIVGIQTDYLYCQFVNLVNGLRPFKG